MTLGYLTGATDTRLLAPETRTRAWREHVTDNHGLLELDFGSAPAFVGTTLVQRCGGVQLVEFWSEAIAYRRRSDAVDRDGDDSLRVVLPLAGSLRIVASGERHDLAPGLAGTVSMERGFSLEQDRHARALILNLPRAWWQAQSLDHPAIWDLGTGPGAVFAAMLRQVAAQRDHLDADSFVRTCEAAALVLPRDAPTDLSAQALPIVREHADQAGFGPTELAARLGWSLRSLQKAMRAAGTSPAEMIRAQRLERAAARLRDPGWRAHTISHIAHTSGFGSVTAFNTSFRARFGCSPTDYRGTA